MSTSTSHRPSDQERAERRARDREYAQQAVERLRSSDGWQQWLRTRAVFHAYSLGNQLLIAMQHPTATQVAGFRAWLKLGYCVRKGEKGIRIWAPCPPTARQLETWCQNGSAAISTHWSRCPATTASRSPSTNAGCTGPLNDRAQPSLTSPLCGLGRGGIAIHHVQEASRD